MGGERFPCAADALPDLLKLATDLFDLCQRSVGGGSLRFELL